MSIHSPESTLIFAFQILNISIKSSRPVGIVIQNKLDLNSFHSSEGKFIDLVAYNVCFIMPNVFARKPDLYFLMSSDLSNFQQLWQRPNFQSLGSGLRSENFSDGNRCWGAAKCASSGKLLLY